MEEVGFGGGGTDCCVVLEDVILASMDLQTKTGWIVRGLVGLLLRLSLGIKEESEINWKVRVIRLGPLNSFYPLDFGRWSLWTGRVTGIHDSLLSSLGKRLSVGDHMSSQCRNFWWCWRSSLVRHRSTFGPYCQMRSPKPTDLPTCLDLSGVHDFHWHSWGEEGEGVMIEGRKSSHFGIRAPGDGVASGLTMHISTVRQHCHMPAAVKNTRWWSDNQSDHAHQCEEHQMMEWQAVWPCTSVWRTPDDGVASGLTMHISVTNTRWWSGKRSDHAHQCDEHQMMEWQAVWPCTSVWRTPDDGVASSLTMHISVKNTRWWSGKRSDHAHQCEEHQMMEWQAVWPCTSVWRTPDDGVTSGLTMHISVKNTRWWSDKQSDHAHQCEEHQMMEWQPVWPCTSVWRTPDGGVASGLTMHISVKNTRWWSDNQSDHAHQCEEHQMMEWQPVWPCTSVWRTPDDGVTTSLTMHISVKNTRWWSGNQSDHAHQCEEHQMMEWQPVWPCTSVWRTPDDGVATSLTMHISVKNTRWWSGKRSDHAHQCEDTRWWSGNQSDHAHQCEEHQMMEWQAVWPCTSVWRTPDDGVATSLTMHISVKNTRWWSGKQSDHAHQCEEHQMMEWQAVWPCTSVWRTPDDGVATSLTMHISVKNTRWWSGKQSDHAHQCEEHQMMEWQAVWPCTSVWRTPDEGVATSLTMHISTVMQHCHMPAAVKNTSQGWWY